VEKNGRMEWPRGYSCIAEKRCIETIQDGAPSTEFMRYGDTIRIEMKGLDGRSMFGAIDQEIVAPGGRAKAAADEAAKPAPVAVPDDAAEAQASED
jgi:fumarylacetoacetate (FAA) hydrolase